MTLAGVWIGATAAGDTEAELDSPEALLVTLALGALFVIVALGALASEAVGGGSSLAGEESTRSLQAETREAVIRSHSAWLQRECDMIVLFDLSAALDARSEQRFGRYNSRGCASMARCDLRAGSTNHNERPLVTQKWGVFAQVNAAARIASTEPLEYGSLAWGFPW